jgi:Mannosylglycerate hydrolase MGH1-like glycoside hydrolase domain/Glycosyl hydrolase family 65, C-terminal domain/F5/8 type C domain
MAQPELSWLKIWCSLGMLGAAFAGSGQVLEKQKLLDAQTFWDNRDWEWYQANIPFLETPDPDIDTTYYYRWELVTKHLTYGSPESGYSFTEFIDRPFWSGTYGAISCPAGHQLYEVRWLKDPRYARDYARYWFRTPGAQPRRYSTWLADAVWAVHLVHPDNEFTTELLPDLMANFQAWEKRHFVPEAGLFWQTGHDDGMEYNINSRQTKDTVRGAPGYRATLNSYLWADALAIEQIAKLARNSEAAQRYAAKAAGIKTNLQASLWDPKRSFFFHRYQRDEPTDGPTIKANTLTYQTGKFAASPHGREQYGYAPWQFNLPDAGYESAWQFLMDQDYFLADYGPTTVERHDPMFFLANVCCFWSGQSWPYATTQTLKALANLLNNYQQAYVTKQDYFRLLKVYAVTHRKNGRPYIAEACHPDTGSWEHHDSFNHSEHYFHSGYTDLIITGLIGLHPRADDTLEINPLAPESWNYFALDDLRYRGRRVSVIWDKTGQRYGRGAGLHILVNGEKIASAATLQRLSATLPPASPPSGKEPRPPMNFAVNNDGTAFPKMTASFLRADARTTLSKLHDGNYWYHASPPNRWTCEGSTNKSDWCAVDFGLKRRIDTVKLYWLDDGEKIVPPSEVKIAYWADARWKELPDPRRGPEPPQGHRANVITFPSVEAEQVRATFKHRSGAYSGLTEFEVWGPAVHPLPRP